MNEHTQNTFMCKEDFEKVGSLQTLRTHRATKQKLLKAHINFVWVSHLHTEIATGIAGHYSELIRKN